jgi:hypothetical protein
MSHRVHRSVTTSTLMKVDTRTRLTQHAGRGSEQTLIAGMALSLNPGVS